MMRRLLFLPLLLASALSSLPAQWVRQNSGTSATLTGVAMIDTATAVAVGLDGSILRTTDAGLTWSNVAAPLSFIVPWNAVSFYKWEVGVAAGDDGGVCLSTDGGAHWLPRPIPAKLDCYSAMAVGNTVYVGADSGWFYESADSGRTWSSQKISAWPLRSLFYWSGPSAEVLSMYALTPVSLCIGYDYFAEVWSERLISQFQGLGSAGYAGQFSVGGGPGYLVGVQGDLHSTPLILRKRISDTAWGEVSFSSAPDGVFRAVAAPSDIVAYACGSGGMIFATRDGGDSWSALTSPSSTDLRAISFAGVNRGFAVGDSGVILHTANGGVTAAKNRPAAAPGDFVLLQSYPNPLNPFNPGTHISFTLPERAFVTLVVYDLLGKEVATLAQRSFESGKHTINWYPGSCAGGVYFCRLSAGSFTAVQRLIYLK